MHNGLNLTGCIFCERDPSLIVAVLSFWGALVLYSAYRSLRKFCSWYRGRFRPRVAEPASLAENDLQ
jgi:hypothetical protein